MTQLDNTPDAVAMISDFVIECRGKGHFLPPSEIEMIRKWLDLTPEVDTLILTLSNILPAYFAKHADKQFPQSLRGIDRKVIADLQHFASRRNSCSHKE